MVAVLLDPLGQLFGPLFHPCAAAAGVLCQPFVIEFIENDNTKRVAEVQETLGVGVVAGAHMIETEILEELQSFFHCARIGCRTQRAERVMIGNTLEQ